MAGPIVVVIEPEHDEIQSEIEPVDFVADLREVFRAEFPRPKPPELPQVFNSEPIEMSRRSALLGNYALDGLCDTGRLEGKAAMDIGLTNPIFQNEEKATAHMEADRWPNGAHCPHCGSLNVHKMAGKTQAGMFLCNDCREKFTVRTGTVFERSHIPLHKWLLALHIMAASKKSVSALQLQRMLGLGSYRTAWIMCHRCREAMKPTNPSPIGGENKVVEADETYIGGKAKNRAFAKTEPKKHIVLALIDRDGESPFIPRCRRNCEDIAGEDRHDRPAASLFSRPTSLRATGPSARNLPAMVPSTTAQRNMPVSAPSRTSILPNAVSAS
jgi:transposase-like protein